MNYDGTSSDTPFVIVEVLHKCRANKIFALVSKIVSPNNSFVIARKRCNSFVIARKRCC